MKESLTATDTMLISKHWTAKITLLCKNKDCADLLHRRFLDPNASINSEKIAKEIRTYVCNHETVCFKHIEKELIYISHPNQPVQKKYSSHFKFYVAGPIQTPPIYKKSYFFTFVDVILVSLWYIYFQGKITYLRS